MLLVNQIHISFYFAFHGIQDTNLGFLVLELEEDIEAPAMISALSDSIN